MADTLKINGVKLDNHKQHVRHSRTGMHLLLDDHTFVKLHKCGCVSNGTERPNGKQWVAYATVLNKNGGIARTLSLKELMAEGHELKFRWQNGKQRVQVWLKTARTRKVLPVVVALPVEG